MAGLAYEIGALVLLLCSSALLSILLGHWAKLSGIEDAPDGHRKLQSRPIPRLGGAAIAVSYLACSLLVFLVHPPDDLTMLSSLGLALGFTLFSFLIGLWDDIATLNTKLKLSALILASLAVTALGLLPPALTSPFGALEALPILISGSLCWLLVFTNASNFMDGSNGLAIGCVGIMLAGLAAITHQQGMFAAPLWWVPLFGAIIGFLYHNLQGTLYAGDAGALGLGALFASLGLASGLNIWTIATLALPFLIDVLMTLIWRARHGRSWLEPHLDHAYQKLRLNGWSHAETAGLYWALSVSAAVAAYVAAAAGGAAPFICFWTLCLVGIILWRRHRRTVPNA